MARALPAGQAAAVALITGARPGYLVELGFATTLRLTTFEGTVTWNSQSWVASGISVSGIVHDGGSAQRATITLPDPTGAYFATVRADKLDDRAATIWSVHGGPASYAADEPQKLIAGFMDAAPNMAERITITITTQGNRVMHSPRFRVAPGVFNHLPPVGERRFWNGSFWTAARAPE